MRGPFHALPGRQAPVLRYAVVALFVIGALIAGVVYVLDRNEQRNEWQQSVTELGSASHIASSAFRAAKANLRAHTGQLATSLPLQRAVVENDGAVLAQIARAEHARITVGAHSFGLLPSTPHVSSTAAITNGRRVLARVTLALPLGEDLLVVLREATPLSPHDALMLVRNGRVISGGPIGARALIRGGRVVLGKTTFAAASAPLGTNQSAVVAVEPVAAIDALSRSYGRFLLLAAAVTFGLALAGATRLGRPLARLVGEVARLRRQAQTDQLTGLANRAALDERLRGELAHADRYGTSVSLVIIDIDNFKQINDSRGHQAGDQMLRAVAKALVASCREIDLAARFGGEEFALVLPGSQLANARRIAERARRGLEAISVPSPSGEPMRVTASLGAAEFPTFRSAEALLAAADAALYDAKRMGKNQVATATARRKQKLLSLEQRQEVSAVQSVSQTG